MLSCIYNGQEFNNQQEGYSEKQIRNLGLSKLLRCPKCNGNVFFCAQGKITSHFKHFENPCDDRYLYKYDINTERHHKSIETFYNWLHNQYPDTQIVKDKYLKYNEQEQKADLYLELDNVKIAFEIQFKYINFEELEEKRAFYKNIGIKDIWIFVKSDMSEPGTPYERYYYRGNNRELYFYHEYRNRFTYYKGLKKENFKGDYFSEYITSTHDLNEIILLPTGRLELPLWRDKYILKLKANREQILKRINEKKKIKEAQNLRESIRPNLDKVKILPYDNTQTINKPTNSEYTLYAVSFYNKDKSDFAAISYINVDGEIIKEDFEIKKRADGKNEHHLTCRKLGENATYIINIVNSPVYKKVKFSRYVNKT